MLKKRYYRLHRVLFLNKLSLQFNCKIKINWPTNIESLEMTKFFKFGATGRFFKKITFLGLAINGITEKRYRMLTLRSVMRTLWNMIAVYNVIF